MDRIDFRLVNDTPVTPEEVNDMRRILRSRAPLEGPLGGEGMFRLSMPNGRKEIFWYQGLVGQDFTVKPLVLSYRKTRVAITTPDGVTDVLDEQKLRQVKQVYDQTSDERGYLISGGGHGLVNRRYSAQAVSHLLAEREVGRELGWRDPHNFIQVTPEYIRRQLIVISFDRADSKFSLDLRFVVFDPENNTLVPAALRRPFL